MTVNKEYKFSSLEHEVLYEFLNSNNMTDKTKKLFSFEIAIDELKKLSTNTGDFIISYPKQKYFGFVFVFIKRCIRKLLRWYINPVIERQNIYNYMVIDILETMNKNIEELKKEVKDLCQHKL
jgi:hypothetical protein